MAQLEINGLPVFEALIDGEGCGMQRISLVDDPAVESNFLAFAKQSHQTYAIADADKRIVCGCVMRADFPIYRRDTMGEYYVVYTPATIRAMAERYLAESRCNAIDLMHDGNEVDGVQMVQWYIKDADKGIVPKGFEDIADGSLFAEFHITNEAIWSAVKEGTFKGFSLEGVFNLESEHTEDEAQSLVDAIVANLRRLESITESDMNILEQFKKALTTVLVQCRKATTDKGILEWDGEEDIAVGVAVFILDESGNRNPADDGNYTLAEDGRIITIEGGVVTAIADAPIAEESPAEESTEEVVEAAEETPAEDAPSEEAPAEETTEEDVITPRLDALEASVNAQQEAIATLQEQIAALQSVSGAEPAHEEFNKQERGEKKGIKSLDNLTRILNA